MYRPTIGLEIHIELKTKTKMFCGCFNSDFSNDSQITLNGSQVLKPNTNVCPICLGHPGTLPTINKKAVESVLKLGLALNSQIPEVSKFDRKNYFYPDLPKGYQISQFYNPLCNGGYLEIEGKKIRIKEIHLEEDASKLIHPENKNYSLIDFNRAGAPLMELVTEPDMHSTKEAREFAEELRLIARYLDISDADMEKGQMRIEVNISLSNPLISNPSRIDLSNPSRINSNESQIILKDESYKIMGLLFKIHNILGPIYKEQNYKDAIEDLLKSEGIIYQREKEIKGEFNNLKIGKFYADFIIDNKILLEIKAKQFLVNEDIRQASRYIKAANLPLGIVINFKRGKLEYRRVINPLFERDSGNNIRDGLEKKLGAKVEIKNLNSFKAVEQVIEYEIKRQTEILDRGEKIIQETRGWDDTNKKTFSQRLKEEACDYRYFPEPDLPIMTIGNNLDLLGGNSKEDSSSFEKKLKCDFIDIEKLKISIPELPAQKRIRFIEEYGLSQNQTEILIEDRGLAEYFEEAVSELDADLRGYDDTGARKRDADARGRTIQSLFNYLTSDLKGLLNEEKIIIKELNITPENFADLIILISKKEISSRLAKDILKEMFLSGCDPNQIIQKKELKQISDDEIIKKTIQEIIIENPKAIEDYKKGKEAVLQFLTGKIMAKLKSQAKPEIIGKLLIEILRRQAAKN